MKAVKILVAVMTALMIAGLGVLGYGLYTKAGPTGRGSVAAGIASPGEMFGTVVVPLPAGGRVEQMVVADGRLAVRIGGSGGDRVVILDPASGRVLGRFDLTAEAPQGAR